MYGHSVLEAAESIQLHLLGKLFHCMLDCFKMKVLNEKQENDYSCVHISVLSNKHTVWRM